MNNPVVVERELLEDAIEWLECHSPGSGSSESFAAQDLRAAIAQPAETDGFQIARHSKRLVEQLREQLSVVTAERDAANSRLHEVAVACATAEQERDKLRAEVEGMRAQRDKMAQILRDLVPGCKWRFMRPRIDQALQEVDGGN